MSSANFWYLSVSVAIWSFSFFTSFSVSWIVLAIAVSVGSSMLMCGYAVRYAGLSSSKSFVV